MSTMAELLNRLAEREKAKFAAHQEATSLVRGAETKTTLAAQKLMELQRAQAQELKVLRAQFEKQLRDTAYRCQQDVLKARNELTEAEAVAEQAEKRQRSAEACAFALLEKLKDMEAHVQKRTKRAEASCAELQRSMDARVKRVDKQNHARLEKMSEHANDVCIVSKCHIENVNKELQDQVARAHVRSEGRVRFKELCQLASTFGNYDMSRDAYFSVKHELIDLWHAQKAATPLALTYPTPLPALPDDLTMTGTGWKDALDMPPSPHALES